MLSRVRQAGNLELWGGLQQDGQWQPSLADDHVGVHPGYTCLQVGVAPELPQRLHAADQVGVGLLTVGLCKGGGLAQQVTTVAEGRYIETQLPQDGGCGVQGGAYAIDLSWRLSAVEQHQEVESGALVKLCSGRVGHGQVVRGDDHEGVLVTGVLAQLFDKPADQMVGAVHRVEHGIAAIAVTEGLAAWGGVAFGVVGVQGQHRQTDGVLL